MPRIHVTPPSRATGELAAAYREAERYMPRVGKLVQICSVRPDWVRLTCANMVRSMETGTLRREDKELLAVATSRAGRCKY
jgi:hypothetical protein